MLYYHGAAPPQNTRVLALRYSLTSVLVLGTVCLVPRINCAVHCGGVWYVRRHNLATQYCHRVWIDMLLSSSDYTTTQVTSILCFLVIGYWRNDTCVTPAWIHCWRAFRQVLPKTYFSLHTFLLSTSVAKRRSSSLSMGSSVRLISMFIFLLMSETPTTFSVFCFSCSAIRRACESNKTWWFIFGPTV